MLVSVTRSHGSRTLHAKNGCAFSREPGCGSEAQLDRTGLIDALSELYDLLEKYAPAWYTQAHHAKAESALYRVKQ